MKTILLLLTLCIAAVCHAQDVVSGTVTTSVTQVLFVPGYAQIQITANQINTMSMSSTSPAIVSTSQQQITFPLTNSPAITAITLADGSTVSVSASALGAAVTSMSSYIIATPSAPH